MITSSQLGRIALCPASESLPHANRVTKWSSAGTAVHAFLERCASGMSATESLKKVDKEHYDLCAQLALETLPHGTGNYAAEVAFAFNVETFEARELGRSIGRDYLQHGFEPKREIGGTADLVAVAEDCVVVLDTKTGYGWQEPDSWQMRANGAMAAMAYGKPEAYLVVLIVHGEETIRLVEKMSALDVATTARQMADVFARVLAAKDADNHRYTTGDHCRYCPAMPYCPAQVKLIKDLAVSVASPLTPADSAAMLSPESAREAWAKLKAAKAAIDHIDEAVRLYAKKAGPVDLGNGKMLGVKDKTTETLDGGVAYRVLEEKHGAEVADKVVEMSATKARLKSAMRTIADQTGQKVSALETEIINACREKGGVRSRTTEEVREYGKTV